MVAVASGSGRRRADCVEEGRGGLTPQVAIVGAGFSGMSAARRLREQGVDDLVVLEARSRIGAWTKHGQITGRDIDLGGMWMGPTQPRLKGCNDGWRRWHVTSKSRLLGNHFGPAALTPLDYVDVDWSTTRWSNGCYGNSSPPGVYVDFGEWLRHPTGVVHWAGTETSPRWTGYVEGAIRSGEAAPDAVLDLLSS